MEFTAQIDDRACGAVIGSAVGDALGAGYEFGAAPLGDEPPAMIGGGLGGFAPGEWTDDTTMAWCILQVAAQRPPNGAPVDLRAGGSLDAIARNFRAWYDTGPADIGIQTASVLRAGGVTPSGETLTRAAYDHHARSGRSGGNGSLMRTAPVVLAHLDDADALAEAARKIGALTHFDPVAQEACVLWCLAIRHAILHAEFDVRAGMDHLDEQGRERWAKWIDEAEARPPGTFRPNGYVVTAFQAAWSAIAQTSVPTDRPACEHFGDALETAIRIGHDTDTVAAIAGALLGARWGLSAIPAKWRRVLHGYPGVTGRQLERLAQLALHGDRAARNWPNVDRVHYGSLAGDGTVATHPYDEGVLLSGIEALDELPAGVDAVVSLCVTGRAQVPKGVEQVTFWLLDEPDPEQNPNLDFVLLDAARTVRALRDEGRTVLLHCVAAHSRTPTVAALHAMLGGAPPNAALQEVCAVLPAAAPNRGFRQALLRLGLSSCIEDEARS